MTPDYDYGAQANCELHLFFIFLRLCSYYITVIIKKLKLCLLVVLILLKIKCGHIRISMTKIDITMSKKKSISALLGKRDFIWFVNSVNYIKLSVHCNHRKTLKFPLGFEISTKSCTVSVMVLSYFT